MAITLDDLLNLEPHKVSRDLRGYSVMLYGAPKTGKTTTACKFPKHLLLAFEKGYSAIPGAMAMPINKWSEFKNVLSALKDENMQKKFSTIIIDTADLAYDFCCKYVANQNDVATIADIGYGKGYGLAEAEFDAALRSIVQMDYGLVLISHSEDKTFTDENGVEYNKIVPTLDKRGRKICTRLCDIIGYSASAFDDQGQTVTRLYMRGMPRYEAGSRFKYTPDSIIFSYDNLVNAIHNAIAKQEEEMGSSTNFTNEKVNVYTEKTADLDYDAMMEEFKSTVGQLMSKNQALYAPKVTEITNKILGRGKKFSDCPRTAEMLDLMELVLTEIRALAK